MINLKLKSIRINQRKNKNSFAFSKLEKTLFLVGLIAKVILGMYFTSYYLSELFIPFTRDFVTNISANPYLSSALTGDLEKFPYPAFMLYILSIPALISSTIFIDVTLLLYRLPLLIADLYIYLVLRSWLAQQHREMFTILYWLSPVTIFISYAHGQLDVLPIAFLIASISYLFRRNVLLSGVLFGIAIATKTSILIILPVFLCAFLHLNKTFKNIILFMAVALTTFYIINLPFIHDAAFWEMVIFNKAQSQLLESNLQIGSLIFSISFFALISLTILAWKISITNKNLFLVFTGFYFCVVLIFVAPMYGWYYWIIPFLAYLFAKDSDLSKYTLFILQLCYFGHFLLLYLLDEDSIRSIDRVANVFGISVSHVFATISPHQGLLKQLSFTALQTCLILLSIYVFRNGIQKFRYKKVIGSPLLVGIGGDSGVGKSSLATAVEAVFGTDLLVVTLKGDDRHKWIRGHENWRNFTHLNPKANSLHAEVDALKKLKQGHKIWRQSYDHSTGLFTEKFPIVPKPVIILEGLHPYYIQVQRQLIDFKIFVEPEDNLARHWKVCRDVQKRSYSVDHAIEQINRRSGDKRKFISTQRDYADLVIEPFSKDEIVDIGNFNEQPEISYKLKFINSLDVDEALDLLGMFSRLEIWHKYVGPNNQEITLSGDVSSSDSNKMLLFLGERLYDLDLEEMIIPQGLYGVVIFLVILMMMEKANKDG